MSNAGFLIVVSSILLAACAPLPVQAPANAVRDIAWQEALRLQAARDYFTLRDRVEHSPADSAPSVLYARALVQHAFNQPSESNATIAVLLRRGALPDSIVSRVRRIRMANHLRLFEYAAGLAVADALRRDTTHLDRAELQDVRTSRRIFAALASTPPQRSVRRGPTTVRIERGRVPVQVNDSVRQYVFDTGANISTIMRSEARALGLRMIPAEIDVGTSTDRRVTADLAVADRLVIGQVHFANSIFLVLDDALLTFPGLRIPGIIGFPVIERMGEIQIGAGGQLSVPEVIPRRPLRNLALHELSPLTRVYWNDVPLLCMLDTGASTTRMYEPFYRRFRERIDAVAGLTTRRTGGAGGMREFPVRVMRQVKLALGETTIVLDSLDVFTQSIARDEAENYRDCNIGHDILDAFSGFVLNFRDMAFLLR